MDGNLDLLAILEREFRTHPRLGPEDLRKLVAQSVFGGDHLLKDPPSFRDGLLLEWRKLPSASLGDLYRPIQPISPDGHTARIHLGPCKARGIGARELGEVLLAQPLRNGLRYVYERRWADVIALAEAGRIPLEPGDLQDLSRLKGLPHHSPGYGPASYRVINDLRDRGITAQLRAWGIDLP